MNKQRRTALAEIHAKIAELYDILEEIKDEEECYMDNMPENLHQSERYEKAEEAVYNLEEALSSLEEAMDCIENAKE